MNVQRSQMMSMTCGCVGITVPRNRAGIFVLRSPESDALTARDHPRPSMSNPELAR
jgi:hypothetical protein